MNALGAHHRLGFTVVELLVSVLVFTTGLIALAGATAVIARQVNGGAQMALAATVAESRFERLRSADCQSLAGGTSHARGIAESWTVSFGAGVVTVHDSVWLDAGRSRRTFAFSSSILCASTGR